MAQRVITTYVSDISGDEITDDSPTTSFSLDGKAYTIDLTTKEAEKMRKALEPYLDVAKPAGRATKPKASPASSSAPSNASAIREWAHDNGYDVPERGRLPKEIKEAYEAAH